MLYNAYTVIINYHISIDNSATSIVIKKILTVLLAPPGSGVLVCKGSVIVEIREDVVVDTGVGIAVNIVGVAVV